MLAGRLLIRRLCGGWTRRRGRRRRRSIVRTTPIKEKGTCEELDQTNEPAEAAAVRLEEFFADGTKLRRDTSPGGNVREWCCRRNLVSLAAQPPLSSTK